MKKAIILLITLIISISSIARTKYTISGYVKDQTTGEELIGASVYIKSANAGTITNTFGFYSITVPEGNYNITASFLGYEDKVFSVNLTKNIKKNIELAPKTEVISEVEIVGEKKNQNVEKVEMSTVKLPVRTIKRIPALLGEVDIIKSIQLLPGVQFAGEGSSGFHVRGGSVDQNLILLDDAPVYNASHFGGFFSVFNSDAIKDVKLYKGGIPAEYGGRLSSVLDIHMNEGNRKQFTGKGGIGLISSRGTIEGPIIRDKSSFILSGRRTYFDLFRPLATDTVARQSRLYFYDLNAKLNYDINDNNRIFVSGYFGQDVMRVMDVIGMDYGNATGTARWNHLFNERLFMNTIFIFSNYSYGLKAEQDFASMKWTSHIRDYNAKGELTYYANPKNTVKLGIGSVFHDFDPGMFRARLDTAEKIFEMHNNYALEHSAFIQNEHKILPVLTMQYGIRLSVFQNIGPATLYEFDKSDPQKYKVQDTIKYGSGNIFNTYTNLEPRIGIRYLLDETSSLKASYNRTTQYVHLATNTTSATPIDVWFPSTLNIKPQIADQVALGYFKNLRNNLYEASLEAYYKEMNNTIDFRDRAELQLNPYLEGEVRSGKAWSYGLEFLVKKTEGLFTGWISYTLSRTWRKIPEINQGKKYLAPYDRTHDISFICNYQVRKGLNVSATWVYSTAPPRTMPTGRFEYNGMIVPVYSDRNTVRIYDYHRLDLGCELEFNKLRKEPKDQRFENSLVFSVYNAYNRKNPIAINFEQDEDIPDRTTAEILYLFSIVPSITYNFTF